MKLAIDSYCYHRQFGDAYPWQPKANRSMSVWDFLRRAKGLGVHGVSLEACYLPEDESLIERLRKQLDAYKFERVWAWGHPDGLRSGTDRHAARDLVKHLSIAGRLGCKVMRIVGGSRRSRPKLWSVHRRQLGRMVRELLNVAEEHGVVLAMENHIDLLADEMVELLASIDSPWLGVCLDTGNNLRLFEDPVLVAEKLAPFTRATHLKDLTAYRGDPRDFRFWPSVPLGDGIIDLESILGFLRKARYQGLLAIEIDYLHPELGEEDRAVARSVRYLRSLVERAAKRPSAATRSSPA
jgi:sugar phosphate isomerase/epimerase